MPQMSASRRNGGGRFRLANLRDPAPGRGEGDPSTANRCLLAVGYRPGACVRRCQRVRFCFHRQVTLIRETRFGGTGKPCALPLLDAGSLQIAGIIVSAGVR
jgi:hypothetical protein